MTDLTEKADLVSITRSNYWNEIGVSYGTTETSIPQDLMREILGIADEKTIDKGFIFFLYVTTGPGETISPELAQLSMYYFPLLFQCSAGAELALKSFDQTPLRSLVSNNVEYPNTLQISWPYYSIGKEQANRLVEKIDHLAELGEEFLQAYALLPCFFSRTSPQLLPKLTPNTAMQYYRAINDTGNQAALLGCILRILAGPVSYKQKSIIWGKLLELLQIDSLVSIWYTAVDSFSMDGKLLVYEAITTLGSDTKRNSNLLGSFSHTILEELEASPVERNELMELSKIAHSDRHFL